MTRFNNTTLPQHKTKFFDILHILRTKILLKKHREQQINRQVIKKKEVVYCYVYKL